MPNYEIDMILPIKRKWLQMIVDGIKLEEYREDKPYWDERVKNIWLKKGRPKDFKLTIMLRNGYSKNSPYAIVQCQYAKKTGKPDWGAEPNVTYITFGILSILEQKGIETCEKSL